MSVEKALREFGLNDKEIKVYLALLSSGTSSANRIAEKADVIRTTTYDILKSLIEQGMASYVIKSGVKYYEASDPETILFILDERRKSVHDVLPTLKKLKESVVEKPKVEMYEGKEGLKTILNDMLITKKEIRGYSSLKLLRLLEYYFPHFIKKRADLGIRTRVIMEMSKESKSLKERDVEELRELRFLDDASRLRVGYYIFGNKVAMLIARNEEPIGILIENEELAEAERLIFEKMWVQAK